ncbi:MAG: hypothetical protein JO180_11600, partial [Gemmatirosa sp.]|nr:hypothetical protein [Gemmatirosa sp.]
MRSSRVWIGVGVNSASDAIHATVAAYSRRAAPASTTTRAGWPNRTRASIGSG